MPNLSNKSVEAVATLMEPAEPMPVVHSMVGLVFNHLEALQAQLDVLEEKLGQVLRPEDDEIYEDGPGKSIGPNSSPLARRVDDAVGVIGQLQLKVQSVLDRVEV